MPAKKKSNILTHIEIKDAAKKLTIPLSFTLPIFTLYFFQPNSFQTAWKGRAPYVFFLWLLIVELALAWKKLPLNAFHGSIWTKISIVAVATLPIVYVTCTNMLGLNRQIIEIGKILNAGRYGQGFLEYHWPLSLEYLLLTCFFTLFICLLYRSNGLKKFPVSLFFLATTGASYMTDTFYPYATLTALQALVPITTSSAAQLLKWIGYQARLLPTGNGIQLWVKGNSPWLVFPIYWPCAGIHSLIIYTLVILLFMRNFAPSLQLEMTRAAIPKKLKTIAKREKIHLFLKNEKALTALKATEKLIVKLFSMTPTFAIFIIGAAGTFMVNILRIVSICIVGVNTGSEAQAADMFHRYYGELYFFTWIFTYLTVVTYSNKIWANLSTLKFKLTEILSKNRD